MAKSDEDDSGFELVDTPPQRTSPRRREEEDQDDDRPRKTKRKNRRPSVADATEESFWATNQTGFIILATGFALLVVGCFGVSMQEENQWNPLLAMLLLVIGQLITIPFTIGCLMVIGTVFGIEYGSFSSAVVNLAGMSFFVAGLSWTSEFIRIPIFIYGLISLAVSISLFMYLLKLDLWETIVTMISLNIISVLFKIGFLILFTVLLASAARKQGGGGFDDSNLDETGIPLESGGPDMGRKLKSKSGTGR